MMWRKNKNPNPVLWSAPTSDSRIEIEVSKNASRQAAELAKKVNSHVNELLVENGITVKIYLVAGGKQKRKKI